MSNPIRRIIPLFFLVLAGCTSLFAYPVAITINVTYVPIQGDPNGFDLGGSAFPTAVITTTLDSAAGTGSSATYPASVNITTGILNNTATGTVTVSTSGL